MDWLVWYVMLGLAVGLIAGMLGIGGGTTLVPILVFLFNAQEFNSARILHLAIATTIATIIFTSVSSVWQHHRRSVVRWDIVKKTMGGLIIGTIVGTFVAEILDTKSLAIFFVLFVYFSSYQLFFDSKSSFKRSLPGYFGISIAAFVIGIVSSLVGAGGGVISIPLMVLCRIPIIQAVGTSAALGFPIALTGSIGYIYHGFGKSLLPELSIGYVYLPALFGIVIGTFITVPYGVRLAHKVSGNTLKKIFSVILFMLATRMLWKFFSI